jgi:hypothetical protein
MTWLEYQKLNGGICTSRGAWAPYLFSSLADNGARTLEPQFCYTLPKDQELIGSHLEVC